VRPQHLDFKESTNSSCMFLSRIQSGLTLNVSSKAINLPAACISLCQAWETEELVFVLGSQLVSSYRLTYWWIVGFFISLLCVFLVCSFTFLLCDFSQPLRVDENTMRVLVYVWPAEISCCIPADCTQVLLNLPSNIALLSKQLQICASCWLDLKVWVFEGVFANVFCLQLT